MTLRDSLLAAVDRLTAAHVPSPRMNAELLLMFTLGRDRAYLFAHSDSELTTEETARYDQALVQRSTGIPAQYITGHQEFWGMDFVVSPAVLIPRPETEHLIETVLPLARRIPTPKVVDVGTGSGCIAIALAKELPEAEIHATDISPDTLEIARANAVRLAGEHASISKIQFHQADLLSGLDPASFDIVVSNPPYVGESEADTVQTEVRKFEPRQAVFAGHSGLEVIERLVPQAQAVLKPGGWLVIEVSGTISDRVVQMLNPWDDLAIVRDLQGIERVVSARVPR